MSAGVADLITEAGQTRNVLEQAIKMSEHKKHVTSEQARIIHATFSSPAGQQCLRMMVAWTLAQPTCVPGSVEGMGYFREGENHIVRTLIVKMGEAENAR